MVELVGRVGGDIVCLCPYCSVVKNVFVVLKVLWASLHLLLLFYSPLPSFILPHTFELLSSIVPWSWLGSLLPRPLLLPGQLAHARPHRALPAGGHGTEARSSEARGPCTHHPQALNCLVFFFFYHN